MFSFAVLGDTHYINEKYHKRVLNNKVRDFDTIDTIQDNKRYVWMTNNILTPIITEIKQCKPNFLIQLGDFVQGECDDYNSSKFEMEEALEIFSSLGIPIFILKGTHEGSLPEPGGKAYRDVVLPFLSGQVRRILKKNYYSVDYENSHFILLDYLQFTQEQYEWLEKDLRTHQNKKHIFIFAHPPLFPIARPFFTEKNFTERIIPLFKRYSIDAYFCGHTHNKSLSLHRLREAKILQIMTCPIGFPGEEPIPLEQVRVLLTSSLDDYYWGYLEYSTPDWLLVKVQEKKVTLNWYLLGKGNQGIIEWEKSGEVKVIKKPKGKPKITIDPSDLKEIKSARLYLSFYNSYDPKKPVFLNGQMIGYAPVTSSFTAGEMVEIPGNKFVAIQPVNKVEIYNPKKELFCVGGIFLEITLNDGRKIRTNASPYIYTTSKEWDNWNLKVLHYIEPGKTISPAILEFSKSSKVNSELLRKNK